MFVMKVYAQSKKGPIPPSTSPGPGPNGGAPPVRGGNY